MCNYFWRVNVDAFRLLTGRREIPMKRHVKGKLVYDRAFESYIFLMAYRITMIAAILFGVVNSIDFTFRFYSWYPAYKDLYYGNTTMSNLTNASKYNNSTSNETSTNVLLLTPLEFLLGGLWTTLQGFLIICYCDLIFFLYYLLRLWTRRIKEKFKCKFDKKKISLFSERRKNYLHLKLQGIEADIELHLSELLTLENVTLFSNLNHSNLLVNPVPRSEICFSLRRYMLLEKWGDMKGNLPPYIDIVLYIRDILNGVKYLHDQNIQHLNLCPDNILIAISAENEAGMAKIGGCNFCRQSDQRMVNQQNIGLEWLYRPPEYFSENRIDAAMVDYWSIGIIAYELLTGGMLTIEADKAGPGQKCHELMKSKKMMELSYFSSAIDGCWEFTTFIAGYNDLIKIDDTMYNLTPTYFCYNAWNFVKSLMNVNPKERATAAQALKFPFINKTINPKLCCTFRWYPSKLYFSNFGT